MKLGLGLASVVVGVFIAWRLGHFDGLSLARIDRLNAWFDGLGFWAPLAFVVLWIAAGVFFLPGLPITVAGGLIFAAGAIRTGDLGRTSWYLWIAAIFCVLLSFAPSWVVSKFGATELQSQD